MNPDDPQSPDPTEPARSATNVEHATADQDGEPPFGDVPVALVKPASTIQMMLVQVPSVEVDDIAIASTSDGLECAEPAFDDRRGLQSQLAEFANQIDRRLDQIVALHERENRAEAAREKVVDRLHEELQEYKQDLVLKMLRPVFLDLIQLHDDLGKMNASLASGQVGPERLGVVLGEFQRDIEDILYRQGVEPFQTEGSSFDAKRQRAVATAATSDAGLSRTVAHRLRPGFRSDEKLIRPELVTVYAYQPPTNDP